MPDQASTAPSAGQATPVMLRRNPVGSHAEPGWARRGVQPHTQQISAGFQRQLGPALSASADYVHTLARDLWMLVNLNPGATTNATIVDGTGIGTIQNDD